MSKNYLFVYGTLRPDATSMLGAAMREHLRVTCLGMGEASTAGTIYDLGPYPGARFKLHNSCSGPIEGFLYRVPEVFQDELYSMLDDYEGEGFERLPTVVFTKTDEVVDAQMYFLKEKPDTSCPAIMTGDWVDYTSLDTAERGDAEYVL